MTGPGVPEHPDSPPRATDAGEPAADPSVSTEEVAADPGAAAVEPAADPPAQADFATTPAGDALPVAEPLPVVAGQSLPGDALSVAEPPPVVAAPEVGPVFTPAAAEPVAPAPVPVLPAVVAPEVPAPVPPGVVERAAVEPVALTPVPLLPAGPEASGPPPEPPGASPPVDLHKKAAPAAAAPAAAAPAAADAGAPSRPEPTAPAEDPTRPPPPAATRRAGLALGLVAVLTALMVAGVAYLGLRLQDESQTAKAREQAVATSRDAARLLFSYDHAKLEEDFAKGLSVTTGAFREEYARTTSQVVAGVAKQYKAVVVADVVESAVVGASPDEVTTLVFLNQATTSTQTQGRQVDQSRVRMRLVNKDGRWLVAEVQAL